MICHATPLLKISSNFNLDVYQAEYAQTLISSSTCSDQHAYRRMTSDRDPGGKGVRTGTIVPPLAPFVVS